MTTCLVTGVAGFIGSHLAERLVRIGYDVIGVDSFTDYYPRRMKRKNISELSRQGRFRFVEGDITVVNLANLMKRVDYVFHLAAQPGVRSSWGRKFEYYVRDNISSTQRLLEAARRLPLKKIIYASSSSIYGDSETLPTPESLTPRPNSPYGATKLAAEHLCRLYWRNFGVPTVTLRYFTVYGPRQRPDMAFHRFIAAALRGGTVHIFGDGRQRRDYTYVDDTVAASVLAIDAPVGRTYNVGTGKSVSLNQCVKIIESLIGKRLQVVRLKRALGDVVKTSADLSSIRSELRYESSIGLREGLKRQIDWQAEI